MKSLLTALSLLITCSAFAFEFTGKVVAVADGDTVTVLYNGNQQHKIRLLHIDCPESTQPFGTKAKTTLSGKIFGKTVTVKWTEMDKYKRILGDIYLGKRWINQEMVQEGMAWHYKFFSKDATIAAAETLRLLSWVYGRKLTLLPRGILGEVVVLQNVGLQKRVQQIRKSSPRPRERSITVKDAVR